MSFIHLKNFLKKIFTWPPNAVSLLALSVLTLIVFFIFDFLTIKHEGAFSQHPRGHRYNAIRRFSSDPTPELIRPWMTFEYINTVFHLPSSFLSQKLAIQDPKYPKISVGSLAQSQKISADALIKDLKVAVEDYPEKAKQ